MKKLYLVDLDTHAIVPRDGTEEQNEAAWQTRNLPFDEHYDSIIHAAPPLEPVTCRTCGKAAWCDQAVSIESFDHKITDLDIGGCDEWEPKK